MKTIHEHGVVDAAESQLIVEKYGLRRVLVPIAAGSAQLEILTSFGGRALEIQLCELMSPILKTGPGVIEKAMALSYDADAVLYHCRNLARASKAVVESFSSKGFTSDVVIFHGRPEP
jgi:hypothetical protein